MEDLVDEMLSILSDQDAIIRKKEMNERKYIEFFLACFIIIRYTGEHLPAVRLILVWLFFIF